jgi:hypothetical protein
LIINTNLRKKTATGNQKIAKLEKANKEPP